MQQCLFYVRQLVAYCPTVLHLYRLSPRRRNVMRINHWALYLNRPREVDRNPTNAYPNFNHLALLRYPLWLSFGTSYMLALVEFRTI